jgi:hypothetical protein
MRRSIIGPIIGAIIILSALGAAGWSVYQAGYRNGLAAAERASDVVVTTPGFFPGFGLFFGFIFFFLVFGFISRRLFWGQWRRGWYGPVGPGDEKGSPMDRRLTAWHQRAHEETGRTHRGDAQDTG